ncbi:dihydrofolate reductase family protein [Jiangella rhizosphaerae]|uniref:Riboflavin biosynthesis protein RibD n=1 Tax=Jiangella rhizosphaerae TaxID=2293569 RepID=A0A418KKA5_9ACTN|nr:dihydrofolate reductase family protein [Jiangella rhizosphaerae]RIQ15788.1 riboflavin biosynthesis protein RibD [Jiangella rhizosphaerae]
MTENTSHTTGRRVVANLSLSLDGRYYGPGGEYDMSWVAPHAMTETAREHMTRSTTTATTVLLGRKNYEGFGGFWPTVVDNEQFDPRDRAYAAWLNEVEKVVFSTTLTETPWQNSRLAEHDPATEVRRLRAQPGGDIVVQNSASIIRTLLAADEIDRLTLNLCPELVGGGARLFEDGVPASSWSLADLATSESGAIYLTYDRRR